MNKALRLRKKSPTLEINRLAIILKEEKITNRALASTLSYEEATVSKWATNAIQPPLSTFLRIALMLDRDLKDFFISSREIDVETKKKLLKELAVVAEKSKRVGK